MRQLIPSPVYSRGLPALYSALRRYMARRRGKPKELLGGAREAVQNNKDGASRVVLSSVGLRNWPLSDDDRSIGAMLLFPAHERSLRQHRRKGLKGPRVFVRARRVCLSGRGLVLYIAFRLERRRKN